METTLEQAALLSTCNRVELYAVARTRPSQRDLTAWLARYHGIAPDELSRATYLHRSGEEAHHLAATAAGMRSLVLGEAQIPGQVRTALEHALRSGTAGRTLVQVYRHFGEVAAAETSPLYERVAVALSESEQALRMIETVPARKRHPTVILARPPAAPATPGR